jgi:hypothetical protein
MLQTAVRLHSSLLSIHDMLIGTPFNPNVHHRGLLDRSSLGQFEASPYKAAPKGVRLEIPILSLNPGLRQRCVALDI